MWWNKPGVPEQDCITCKAGSGWVRLWGFFPRYGELDQFRVLLWGTTSAPGSVGWVRPVLPLSRYQIKHWCGPGCNWKHIQPKFPSSAWNMLSMGNRLAFQKHELGRRNTRGWRFFSIESCVTSWEKRQDVKSDAHGRPALCSATPWFLECLLYIALLRKLQSWNASSFQMI